MTTPAGDAPGLGLQSVEWIGDNQLAAVATDTWGLEVRPNETADTAQPLHIILIVHMGLWLGEIFDFEPLAADCARTACTTSCSAATAALHPRGRFAHESHGHQVGDSGTSSGSLDLSPRSPPRPDGEGAVSGTDGSSSISRMRWPPKRRPMRGLGWRLPESPVPLLVRTNGPETAEFWDDIVACGPGWRCRHRHPKAEHRRQLRESRRRTSGTGDGQRARGRVDHRDPLIESALGSATPST